MIEIFRKIRKSVDFKNPKKIVEMLICVVCFLSVFSQAPMFISRGVFRYGLYVSWAFVAFLVFVLFWGDSAIKKLLPLFTFVPFFVFVVSGYVYDVDYIKSGSFFNVLLAYFIFILGFFAGGSIRNRSSMRRIFNAYLLGSIFPSLFIFAKYLFGSDITSYTYSYASKNSISIIFGLCICIMIFFRYERKWLKIVSFAYSAFLFLSIILLRCRTVLLSFPILFVLYLFHPVFKKREKVVVCTSLAIILFVILVVPTLRELLIKGVFMGGRSGVDINSISSNRMMLYKQSLYYFSLSPFTGIGAFYVDSLYIDALTQFGVFGFLLFLPMVIFPVWITCCYAKSPKIGVCLLAFSVVLFVNSLLEAYTPFGPGTNTFLYWLILGCLYSKDDAFNRLKRKAVVI